PPHPEKSPPQVARVSLFSAHLVDIAWATYVQVRLIPQDSRASPADLFTMPSQMGHFLTFYDVVKFTPSNLLWPLTKNAFLR
ncbi:MAG TPA: hypothetical protein PK621_09275, partial [Syntrophales bacterium]|nr:hypothetical protein [Syntrophales bacterium]